MKLLSLIGIFLLAGWSYGQSWRDSLQSARKAYFSKKYDQAERSYLFAEKSLNGKTDLSSEKAQNAYRSGNYNGAIEQYKRGIKNAKTVAKKVDTHYNLGTAHLKQKQYKEAIQAYKNALRLDPFNNEAQYNLSQAIRKLQQSKNKRKAKDNKTKDNKTKGNKTKDNKTKDKRQNDQNRENRTTKDERRNRNSQKKNAADRILDKLQKDEAATKRKLNNARSKRKGTSETSEYDW
jgi:Ca-activated chloride channel family protein